MSYITKPSHIARRPAVYSISQLISVPTSHSQLECWATPWLHRLLRTFRCQATEALPNRDAQLWSCTRQKRRLDTRAFSDANWGVHIDRKSTSGALHFVSYDLVHWECKNQGCVAFSTAEAEYVAASSCAQDMVWLCGVLFDLKLQHTSLTVIVEDNTAAIKWNCGGSCRAKHNNLEVCFVHEVVSMKHIILKYLPTDEQVANILTKPCEASIFSFLHDKLGFSRVVSA
jgi:hypothetical protein